MLYIDSSAFSSVYLEEARSEVAVDAMRRHPSWMTARLTAIEVLRALHRGVDADAYGEVADRFAVDWERARIIAQDEGVANFATEVALEFDVRTLDAIHLASAWQAGEREITFLTFDRRQAVAARALEFEVIGVA